MLQPRRADLDMNKHVNNVTYYSWLLQVCTMHDVPLKINIYFRIVFCLSIKSLISEQERCFLMKHFLNEIENIADDFLSLSLSLYIYIDRKSVV